MAETEVIERETSMRPFVRGEETQETPTQTEETETTEVKEENTDQETEETTDKVENKEEEVSEKDEQTDVSTEEKGQSEEETGSGEATGQESEVSEQEMYNDLTQESGVDIKSYEDVVKSLKELKALKENPYNGVSNLLKEAIKAEQQGIDPGRFIQLSKTDFDKMDSRRILFEQFITKNPDLYASNPSFAERKFNRDFMSKYGVIDKTIDPETMEESEINSLKEEQQFARDSLDYDAGVARKELNDLKGRALTPDPSTQPPPEPTKEEVDKMKQEAEAEADSIMESFDSLEVPFGKEKINIQINNKMKEEIRQGVLDPLSFLGKYLGIDASGEKFNKEQFASAAAWLLSYSLAGDVIGKLAVEKKNKEIVTDRIENSKKKGDTTVQRSPSEYEPETSMKRIR